jgi:hypothetical protein
MAYKKAGLDKPDKAEMKKMGAKAFIKHEAADIRMAKKAAKAKKK